MCPLWRGCLSFRSENSISTIGESIFDAFDSILCREVISLVSLIGSVLIRGSNMLIVIQQYTCTYIHTYIRTYVPYVRVSANRHLPPCFLANFPGTWFPLVGSDWDAKGTLVVPEEVGVAVGGEPLDGRVSDRLRSPVVSPLGSPPPKGRVLNFEWKSWSCGEVEVGLGVVLALLVLDRADSSSASHLRCHSVPPAVSRHTHMHTYTY